MCFFSVVIPLYNKQNFVTQTVNSVLNQSFIDFEVIIIDDGSTDNSYNIIKQINDERIKIFQQINQGVSAARNFGVSIAKGSFITLLDADDFWYPNHLQEFYNSLELFPNASVYCNAYQLILPPHFIQNASYNLDNIKDIQVLEDYFEASRIHPLLMTSGVAFKKQDFWDVGGFRKHITSGQDIDLWIRFGLYKKIVFNPVITFYYDKTVPNSLSKKHLRKVKYDFLNDYKSEEFKNVSLKVYLDLNRYAVAIQCKYYHDIEILRLLKKEINYKSLNWKQIVLLHSPSFLVIGLKKIHSYLISKNIYLTAFK